MEGDIEEKPDQVSVTIRGIRTNVSRDQIEGDVEFRFSDGSAPTVVLDASDASALYVLMPMRV